MIGQTRSSTGINYGATTDNDTNPHSTKFLGVKNCFLVQHCLLAIICYYAPLNAPLNLILTNCHTPFFHLFTSIHFVSGLLLTLLLRLLWTHGCLILSVVNNSAWRMDFGLHLLQECLAPLNNTLMLRSLLSSEAEMGKAEKTASLLKVLQQGSNILRSSGFHSTHTRHQEEIAIFRHTHTLLAHFPHVFILDLQFSPVLKDFSCGDTLLPVSCAG